MYCMFLKIDYACPRSTLFSLLKTSCCLRRPRNFTSGTTSAISAALNGSKGLLWDPEVHPSATNAYLLLYAFCKPQKPSHNNAHECIAEYFCKRLEKKRKRNRERIRKTRPAFFFTDASLLHTTVMTHICNIWLNWSKLSKWQTFSIAIRWRSSTALAASTKPSLFTPPLLTRRSCPMIAFIRTAAVILQACKKGLMSLSQLKADCSYGLFPVDGWWLAETGRIYSDSGPVSQLGRRIRAANQTHK